MKFKKIYAFILIIISLTIVFTGCGQNKSEKVVMPKDEDFKLTAKVSADTLSVGDILDVTVNFENTTDYDYDFTINGDLITAVLIEKGKEPVNSELSEVIKIAAKSITTKTFRLYAEKSGDFVLKISANFGIKPSKTTRIKYYSYQIGDKEYIIG